MPMPLSPIDIYQNVLPRTDCGECGFKTCLAFATKVVSEQLPLGKCPHLNPETIQSVSDTLRHQYASGRWLKRDTAEDALIWAKERATSMAFPDLARRIGGELIQDGSEEAIVLPYFQDTVLIKPGRITAGDGSELTIWEQVFLFNHLAQGGMRDPVGTWKAFGELPNTVSKVKTMRSRVEEAIAECFRGRPQELKAACHRLGGKKAPADSGSADLASLLHPLPKVPILLLFWDQDPDEGFDPEAKLLFDATVTEHLDIESILFLAERVQELLCTE